jgi:YidC/Oxa1 family membrane protein insertase
MNDNGAGVVTCLDSTRTLYFRRFNTQHLLEGSSMQMINNSKGNVDKEYQSHIIAITNSNYLAVEWQDYTNMQLKTIIIAPYNTQYSSFVLPQSNIGSGKNGFSDKGQKVSILDERIAKFRKQGSVALSEFNEVTDLFANLYENIIEDDDAESRKTFSGVELVAAFDQYTATVMYGFDKDTSIIIERDQNDNPVVYFEGMQNTTFHGYVGPKEYKTLKNIKPVLTNVIEYGWFTFAAKPLFRLLSWLYGMFGNWGWAIIALTLLIRAILYPLTYKGMMSMQKIKELSPKLKEIKEKYKGDPQRLNAATMEMYKKHNANPLGGCLPMLLQIPVFFAVYRVLLNAVELQGAPWMLWVTDLSRMDEYYILPILMGASMFYQQRLTPNNFTDPMQEKIMKYLPVIFTFFFLSFPSGLVLYWFVNNLFSILQQFIVNQQFANQKDAQAAIAKNEAKKDSSGSKK